MNTLIEYIQKPVVKLPMILQAFASKKGIVMAPVAVVPVVVSVKWALVLFFAFMITDFLTGIWASYFEARKAQETIGKPYSKFKLFCETISSEKLRKSAVKLFFYLSTILLTYGVEKIFLIKAITATFTEAHFTITTLIIVLWIVFEAYSIVFENFKRMGIDVTEKLSRVVKKIKSTKKTIDL